MLKNCQLFLVLFLVSVGLNAQQKPNIICILADDLGYEDLGCFGSLRIKTPNLDKMIQNGIKSTQQYATPLCAPSTAAMITVRDMGHCEIRGNMQNSSTGNIEELPLMNSTPTVAEVLKKSGYSTAMIG